jgi:hypothetical protein
MSFIIVKDPSSNLEKYLDATKSILDMEYFNNNKIDDLLKESKISGVYYDSKYYSIEENKLKEEKVCPDMNISMEINYKDVIRAYKIPRHIKKYNLFFRPKKDINKSEFYEKLGEEKKYFELVGTILKIKNIDDENLEHIIGKVLSITNKEFYCDGYILYDRPVTKDKKIVKIKKKCAIIMKNGLYEYNNPETIKFKLA